MTVENQLFEDVPHQLNMVMFYCHVSFRGNSPLEKSSVARGIQNVARKKKKKKHVDLRDMSGRHHSIEPKQSETTVLV